MRKNLVLFVLMVVCLCPGYIFGDESNKYLQAAEKGDANAQYNLGVCYDKGDGVKADPVEAKKWFRKAAEQGHAEAAYSLGSIYYNGKEVSKRPASHILKVSAVILFSVSKDAAAESRFQRQAWC